jgi:hypothetical protein
MVDGRGIRFDGAVQVEPILQAHRRLVVGAAAVAPWLPAQH